jgi:outer membrane protein assembly factor BamB
MIRALDRESGQVVWEYETSRDDPASFHGDPLVVEELFLIGTDGPNDDGIYAIDWATGALRWMVRAPSRGFGALGVASDIQSLKGRVYATSLADELMCVSITDGSLLWSRQSGFRKQEWILNGTPAITQRTVFFGGMDGTAYAVKSEDGERVWESHLGESIRTSVCVVESGVVMGTTDGTLHLLDVETGSVKSQLSLDKEPSGAIVEADGMLLVCTDWIRRSSELMCVDTSLSRTAWTLESPEGTSWSTPRPYIYGEHVFLGNTRGAVFEYRITDGQLVRSTRVEGVIRGIRLVDDVLYVGTQDGTVYAIKR